MNINYFAIDEIDIDRIICSSGNNKFMFDLRDPNNMKYFGSDDEEEKQKKEEVILEYN